jgi:acetyl-CoA acetyltransferase
VDDVFIVGAFSTAFGKRPQDSLKDLTREAYLGVLSDAGMSDGRDVEFAYFGNCAMHRVGQTSIRGQVCFTPLVREGLFPERVPMINVENACATSSSAIHSAWKDVLAGQSDLVLAVGVEKIYEPAPGASSISDFGGGIDQLDPQEWVDYYRAAANQTGKAFEPGSDRSIFMDTYAMQALYHMRRYGTTQRQLAIAAAKTHNNGALNPKAQYRFEMTPEAVLEDRVVSYPFTRAMCAPIGDGAAAVLVCSADYLQGLDAKVRDRAVKIRASVLTGGKYRALDERGLSHVAARKAYEMSGLTPQDVDIAEVHDATSFSEIYQSEMLGFCPEGEGGKFIESGAAHRDGRLPLNVSGGLVSKGHPVAATGASMVGELVQQLRGEAAQRQIPDVEIALAENGGGVIGFDEAVCSVIVLERT